MSSFWQWLWGETPPSPSSLISCSGAAGGSSSSSSRLIRSSDDLAEENVIVSRKAASPPRTKQQQQEQEIWEAAVQRLLQDSTTTTATITNKVQPATILTHVKQRQRWDCGLACLQMVFHWIADDDNNDDDNNNDAKDENKNKHNNNNNSDDSMYEWLVQHVGTQSVWTVDLVILLHEKLLVLLLLHSRKHSHQANFLFTTRNLTVNPDFSNLPYYKAAFQQDARRVQARIDTIRELKLPAYELLSENTVSMRGVIELVQRPDTVAIVLVDNAVLRQSSSSSSNNNNNNGSNNKTPYAGHYIILAGIVTSTTTSKGNSIHDDNMDETMESFNGCCFVVYNPALDGPDPVHIPIHHIEKAWKAKGTDQDIIFVTKKR